MTERYEANRVLWDGSQAALDRFQALGATLSYTRFYYASGRVNEDKVFLRIEGFEGESFDVPMGDWVVLTVAGYWELDSVRRPSG